MSLIKDGKLVYPMKQYKVELGKETVYNRDTRGKSWFVLDLALLEAGRRRSRFIPAESTGLLTIDDEVFYVNTIL